MAERKGKKSPGETTGAPGRTVEIYKPDVRDCICARLAKVLSCPRFVVATACRSGRRFICG